MRLDSARPSLASAILLTAGALAVLIGFALSGSRVLSSPAPLSVPIVFTSRSGCASLAAALPRPAKSYPGTMVERAIPGRLMLASVDGKIVDLTGGKALADGQTLVDVMSPSVSPDARSIVFAGIKSRTDHFRLYRIDVDGSNLRQLTGLPGDPGCLEPPFLLYSKAGERLPESERRSIDYDDLDPAFLPDGRIVFSSTRLPRIALYDGRRASNLFVMNADGSGIHQITHALSGERWPYVLKDGRILFSYWSRTLMKVSAGKIVVAANAQSKDEELLPNTWWPATVNPDGTDLRALAKPMSSAVHARPLFNGRIVYASNEDRSFCRAPWAGFLEQADPGLIRRGSGGIAGPLSSLPAASYRVLSGPGGGGSPPWAVSPSALPPGRVIFSYARAKDGSGAGADFGIYAAADDWAGGQAVRDRAGTLREFEAAIALEPIVDLKGTCEADAQAVYRRRCLVREDQGKSDVRSLSLAGRRTYRGPAGGVTSTDVYASPTAESPGQETDKGEGPIFVPPPPGLLKAIEFFAVEIGRDRDNLPDGRVGLASCGRAPVSPHGGFQLTVPAGRPLMQVGLDAAGRPAEWTSAATDKQGKSARLSAFAGDHFGYATEGVPRAYCVGCHTGHTVLSGKTVADMIYE